MLSNVLNEVLGSTAKVQLLRAVLPLRSSVSGREAQKLARVRSDAGARKSLRDIADLGLLLEERTAGARLYRVNPEHHLVPVLQALFDAEAGRLASLQAAVAAEVERSALHGHIESVILFGSAARGDARAASDLDLLVVVDSAKYAVAAEDLAHEAAERLFRVLGVTPSPLVMERRRLRERYRAGDPLLHNIESEGRVLLGKTIPQLVSGR